MVADPLTHPAVPDVEAGRGRGRDLAIFRGVVAAVANRLLSAGSSLVTLAIAARSVSKEEFGLIAAVVSLWMILTMLDLGIGGMLSTHVARAFGHDDSDALRTHLRDALSGLIAIGVVLAVAGGVSAFFLPWGQWLGTGLPASTVQPAVALMFVLAGASMPAVVGIATLTGQQRMATAQIAMASGSIATVTASATAAALDLPPWTFVVAIIGFPTLIGLGLTVRIVRAETAGTGPVDGLTVQRIVSTVRASGYFAVINASTAVALGTGTVIVATVLGPGEAAVFSVASRMYATVSAVIAQSGAQLWPALTEAIARKDFEWVHTRYRRSIVVVTLVATSASVILVAIGRPLARLWVGASLVPSIGLLACLGALTIATSAAGQIATLSLAAEHVRPLAGGCVVNALVGTATAVALTYAIGPTGASLGPLVSAVLILVPGFALTARRTAASLVAPAPSPVLGRRQSQPGP